LQNVAVFNGRFLAPLLQLTDGTVFASMMLERLAADGKEWNIISVAAPAQGYRSPLTGAKLFNSVRLRAGNCGERSERSRILVSKRENARDKHHDRFM
jgi:hypothetical protein